MEDPEVIELRNKIVLGLIIIIVFLVPLFIFFYNKSGVTDNKIINKINNEKRLFILIRNSECNNCKNIEKVLKNENINYIVLNKDIIKNYNYIIRKLDISSSDIITPTLLYVEESKNYASLVDIKNESEVEEFINNYKQ